MYSLALADVLCTKIEKRDELIFICPTTEFRCNFHYLEKYAISVPEPLKLLFQSSYALFRRTHLRCPWWCQGTCTAVCMVHQALVNIVVDATGRPANREISVANSWFRDGNELLQRRFERLKSAFM